MIIIIIIIIIIKYSIGSWWGNRRERDHWGNLGVDGWIILGWISRRWDVGMWTGLGWSRQGQVADACECGNEPSVSIKMRGIS